MFAFSPETAKAVYESQKIADEKKRIELIKERNRLFEKTQGIEMTTFKGLLIEEETEYSAISLPSLTNA